MNTEKILLDLFSGIGGFHKGLEKAGINIKTSYFSEIDKHAIANYKYNFKNAKHIGSVEHVLNAGIERPNIITFGSPCQDFSLAGKRKGLEGERSSLIEYALSAISHYRPDVFIWENVKGTFSSNNSEDFWAIIQAFANIGGYQIEWQLLNTAWVLPQNRERIYLVGRIAGQCRREVFPITEANCIGNETRKVEKAIHENSLTLMKKMQYNLNGSFIQENKIIQLNEAQEFGGQPRQQNRIYSTDGIAPAVVKGRTEEKLKILVKQTPKILSRGHGFNKGGMNDICPTIRKNSFEHNSFVCSVLTPGRANKRQNGRRMKDEGEPAFTLTSQDRHGVYDGCRIRKLTEIECERLQGFSDNWTKYGNYDGEIKEIASTNRYGLCGNSVTVNIVEMVGKIILKNTTL